MDAPLSLLKEKLDYNPETGALTWRNYEQAGKCRDGMLAGSKTKRGYIQIQLSSGDKKYHMMAHRAAWMIHHNVQLRKDEKVDHKDSDGTNNRISNMRLATSSENNMNAKIRKDNTTKIKGVSKHPCGKYWARISKNKKTYNLGLFVCKFEAGRAVDAKRKELHGEFANEG